MVQTERSPSSAARPAPLSADALQAVRRALIYVGNYRLETVGAFAALVLVSAANLAAPLLLGWAIDGGLAQGQWSTLLLAVGGLVVIAVVRGLGTFGQGYLAERASQGVAYDLRNALFAQIERLSFSYYDRTQTGQLLTRLTNDVEQVRTFVSTGVVQLAAAGLMLLGTTTLLLVLNWQLALVALLIIPPITILLARFVALIGPLFATVQQALGRVNTVLQEDLQGVRVIRAFSREDYEVKRYAAANTALRDRNIETVRAQSNNFPFVMLCANLGTLLVIWFGGYQSFAGRLTIGELIAFNTYLTYLLQPILTLGFLAASIGRAGASAVRIFEILDAPLQMRNAPNAQPLPPISGRVEFRDVRFQYIPNDREILRGISFVAEPGQMVAVLGTTGAGKSTLINLIPRFYDVSGGSVLIDGHDVRDVTLTSLRGQIGIVLQAVLLFSGSVRDNIAYSRPDAEPQGIEAAARAAQAHDFITQLPQGYDTIIGERGVGLSGGQRQRIAIARALLIDPRLLILDDSTSALDADTEAEILAALDAMMRDRRRTVFVIAQRVSTVRDADLILVLDQGVIVAQGTHDELLETSPLYNAILGSQLQSETTAPLVDSAGTNGVPIRAVVERSSV